MPVSTNTSVTPVLSDLTPFSGLHGQGMHVVYLSYTYMHGSKIFMTINKKEGISIWSQMSLLSQETYV